MINAKQKDMKNLFTLSYICSILIALLLIGDFFVYAIIPDSNSPLENINLFIANPLAGLLFYDLLGMIAYILYVPLIFSIYLLLNQDNKYMATLSVIIFFIGITIFFAANTGFSMLCLSKKYVMAQSEADKALLLAAAMSMMTLFDVQAFMISYTLVSLSWLLISILMVRSKHFNRLTAYSGIIAGSAGIIAEVFENTLPILFYPAIVLYFLAIVFLVLWVTQTGRYLFLFTKAPEHDLPVPTRVEP